MSGGGDNTMHTGHNAGVTCSEQKSLAALLSAGKGVSHYDLKVELKHDERKVSGQQGRGEYWP
jgi:hypothetical protein